MKKVLKFLIWIIWIVLFFSFSILLLINNKHFQKKILANNFKNISFKRIIVSFSSVQISNLSVKEKKIVIKNLNLKIKYSLLKLPALYIKKVYLNIDKVDIHTEGNKKTKKVLNELILPKLTENNIEIETMKILVKQININDFLIDNINLYGNIINKKITLTPISLHLNNDKYHFKMDLYGKIKGVLNKGLDILFNINGQYGDYNLFFNINNTTFNFKNYSLNINCQFGEKDIVKVNIHNFFIQPFKKSIKLMLKNLNINSLDITKITNLIQFNKFAFNISNIKLTYFLNGKIDVASGNVHIKTLINPVGKYNLELNKSLLALNILLKKSKAKFSGFLKTSGRFEKNNVDLNGKINGNITKFFPIPEIDLTAILNAVYNKNNGELQIWAEGNPNNIKTELKLNGNINDLFNNNYINGTIKANLKEKIVQLKGNGSGNLTLFLKNLTNEKINITNQEVEIFFKNNIEHNRLSLLVNPFNKYLTGNVNIALDLLNKNASIKELSLTLSLHKFPFYLFNLKDIAFEKGNITLISKNFILNNMNKLQGNFNITFKNIQLSGKKFSKIYSPILNNNSLVLNVSGNLKKNTFLSTIQLNTLNNNIYGKYKVKYNKNGLFVNGIFTLDSKKGILPIYEPFIFRGKMDIPVDILMNQQLKIHGKLIFNKLYIMSPQLKINRLNGEIPFNVNLNTIFKKSLPQILEKPIVEITPEEKKKYNLSIDRIYYENYMLYNLQFNINFNNYLDVENFIFNFALGVGNGELKYVLSNKFWFNFNFTNGYVYELLKNSSKNFSKEDTKINVHALIYGTPTELNGYIKMPQLGRSVLLNILYIIDPENKDPQIASLKNKVKFLGYYPEYIDISLDGSTMSLYIPLKKRGINPFNIPFSLQNIPIKKILKSMK